ncbi:hypothetical protein Ahy_A08g039597 [Arachis hypogaea]|uniref:Replication factor A C-terminal domain-containing protein n=1 Tax=Arachis hypogaea TaxID=3818 RepID=A0A445BWQ2_ARAHY|nr:hypothetical protein Ahy_A08g039597 [Arachis hypogaea]
MCTYRVVRLWTLPNYRNSPLPYENYQRTDMYRLSESSSIPQYGFKFVSFDTLDTLGYDCTYLVNVVGYLTGIGSKKTLKKDDKFINFVRFEEPKGNIGGIPNEAAFLKIYQGKIIEQLKELDTTGGTVNANATGLHMFLQKFSNVQVVAVSFYPRYRIKLGVIDDSDCTYFVIFDKEAKQILGKSCVEILDPLLLDVDYTDSLLPISKASSIIEGEKVEGAKNLLLEFSNEVAANDESELLENAITPTKRLSSESEDSKVEGDTSTCKKIKIENET